MSKWIKDKRLWAVLGALLLIAWGGWGQYSLKVERQAHQATKTALSEAKKRVRVREVVREIRVPVEVAGRVEYKVIKVRDNSSDTASETRTESARSLTKTAETIKIKADNNRVFLAVNPSNYFEAGLGYSLDLPLNLQVFGSVGADFQSEFMAIQPKFQLGAGYRF